MIFSCTLGVFFSLVRVSLKEFVCDCVWKDLLLCWEILLCYLYDLGFEKDDSNRDYLFMFKMSLKGAVILDKIT